MAFIKRTWLARIGTGLNKFIIGALGGDGKQTLTNSPDSVSQQGDVISADNLNDLENRIGDGFDDVANQFVSVNADIATKVPKTTTVNNKALSNNITITMEDLGVPITSVTFSSVTSIIPAMSVGELKFVQFDDQFMLPVGSSFYVAWAQEGTNDTGSAGAGSYTGQTIHGVQFYAGMAIVYRVS